MASPCTKRLCTNERFFNRPDSDCWRFQLIHCVGLDNILEVLLGTRVLEDLGLLKDRKPASVSNWSFDDNCLFCCLRRENVKEHVVTLNKQIVESGGKPLLGQDPSNITRLELHSEEFLNAVFHRKEYKPRIPDPHIPVVACGVVQQMIKELATHYTSRKTWSQDSLQTNGKKDQSIPKASFVGSSIAADVASAESKFIMVDQDAPLDLSVKKVKVEDVEQDGVLDLSTKKNFNKSHTPLKNSHHQVSPAEHLVKRDSVNLSLAQDEDLQSASTLEQFMSKLCLHHQRQIVDALGFLQSEVKTVASPNHFPALPSNLSEKLVTSNCSQKSLENRPERTCSLEAEESTIVRTTETLTGELVSAEVSSFACARSEKPVDLCKMDVLSNSGGTGLECGKTSSPTKCPVVTQTTTDHLEENSSSQQIQCSDFVKRCPCCPEQCLPTCTVESDHLLSEHALKSSFAQKDDVVIKTSTNQKTSNVVLPASQRTARKSIKGSCLGKSNGSLSCVINDPDSHCDLVYIRKSITECHSQSRNRLRPRQNARKSTRGHRYFEEYLELKTVRTLARKSVGNSSGNCPVDMPDLVTSVTPKQVLSKSGSVPLVKAPFAGFCMKNVIEKQIVENEMPGDVVKVTGLGLVIETSQTGKIMQSSGQITPEPSRELTVQPDLITEAHVIPNAVVQEHTDIAETIESTELCTQQDQCESQVLEQMECGSRSMEESLAPSVIPRSPNMDKVYSADEIHVELRSRQELESPTQVESAMDVQKQPEGNAEENGSAQEEVLHDVESSLQTENSSKLPMKTQGDSAASSLTEILTAHPLGLSEKVEVPHTSKVCSAKHPASSDRCLRSRSSKGIVDVTKASGKTTTTESVHASNKSQKKHPTESNEPAEKDHDLKTDIVSQVVKTKPKSRTTAASVREEHPSPSIKVKEELPSVSSPEVIQETANASSTTSRGGAKPHKVNNETSECTVNTPQRNKSSPGKSNSRDSSPIKKSPPSSENMLLRSRSSTERPFSNKSSNPTESGHSEKQGMVPVKRNSSVNEQVTKTDLSTSSEGAKHMPLRSRTSNSVKQTVTRESPTKGSIKSPVSEQPAHLHSSPTCTKAEATGHMPLRSSSSSVVDPPLNDKSVGALESPGRMLLRRGTVPNTDKTCASTTSPSRLKRLLRQQPVSTSSSVGTEESPLTLKHIEAQIKSTVTLQDEVFTVAGQRSEPTACSPPRFLEALRRVEYQQLISNLNTKFDKLHKGWVQMDKDGQPAQKPKNRADRLKEIWKSKRRVRKTRPLEQQRFSPVQMLFMKPFDLPSICKWFLQSTETKSLVIVKKANTRLPSETQLCFHTSAAGAGSSNGIFPSVQAERLKKHLKKFAIASPVKSNPKNQRLISKALGEGISVMRGKEKHVPTTATRICTKAQSLAGMAPSQVPETLGTVAGSGRSPASARILRKYSNMREKLQVQQSKKRKEKTFQGVRLKAALRPKKASKTKGAKRVSPLTNIAKANPALKERSLKRTPAHKDGATKKRFQKLKKVIGEHSSVESLSRKLLKSRTDKAQQLKASGAKVEAKRSVFQKGPNGLDSQSSDVDVKPVTLEDQVLTRSQRKMEVSPSTSGSPKSSKRGSEPALTPTKRARTSKS